MNVSTDDSLDGRPRPARLESHPVHYLYGSKPRIERKLVATFSSQQQLLAYVRWATLAENEGIFKFEQQSALASYDAWSESVEPLTDDDPQAVVHNPSPTML